MLVHAVNPWGMAWWRRANEHNVDLNRNWQDFDALPANEPYRQVHELICPEHDPLDDADEFVRSLGQLVDEHGIDWVRRAITGGQYTHPDGLYHGGTERQPSTLILERIVGERLSGVGSVLAVDLHTGYGRYGTATLLSPAPVDGSIDRWLRGRFPDERIEGRRTSPAGAEPAPRVGQLAPGVLAGLEAGRRVTVTLELGTRSDTRMIVAERAEHWVHRFGDRTVPRHRAAVWEHRVCSTPDDPVWESAAIGHGRRVVDRALAAVGEWGDDESWTRAGRE